MAFATINPATGETVKTFESLTGAEVEERLARPPRPSPYRRTAFAQRAEWMNARRRPARGRSATRSPRMMTTEMGKTLASAAGRGGQVRQGMSLLRRERRVACSPTSPADAASGRREPRLHPLPAARRGARRDAVELPALAGRPVRRAGADGRQRRAAQARVERAADRAATSTTCSPAAGFPDGCVPDAADRSGGGRAGPARSAGGGRHAHRQRTRRPVGRADRRRRDQAHRAGARRQRPVHRDAVGRPRRGRQDRGHRPGAEQRPVLHRRQAVHRARRRLRRVRRPVRRSGCRR